MHIASIVERSNYLNPRAFIKLLKGRGNVFKGNIRFNDTKNIFSSYMDGQIDIGNNCLIRESSLGGKIAIGDHCRITGSRLAGEFEIGRYTSIWGPNIFMFQKFMPIKIGNFCSIGRGVSLQEFNHNKEKITTYLIGSNFFNERWSNEATSKGGIIVENDVWIGANSFITSGVTVANGTVVAGNSVVTKSTPPFSIVAGNPAKVIRYRFGQELIRELLEIKWWEWNDEKIRANKFLFTDDIDLGLLQSISRE